MEVKISVIICTRDRQGQLKDAINSVLANTYPYFDLMIIDQSKNSETRDLIETYVRDDKRINYIYCLEKGASRGRNLGIKKTAGEIIAVTDDDCVVASDWIKKIAFFFETHEDVAALFGDVIPMASSNYTFIPWYYAKNKRFNSILSLPKLGIGANLSFRREVFEKVGGYDEYLGAGAEMFQAFEEWDFGFRVLALGYIIYDSNSIKVWHKGARNFRGGIKLMRGYHESDAAGLMKLFRCGYILALPLLFLLVTENVYKVINYTLRFSKLKKRAGNLPFYPPDNLFDRFLFCIYWISLYLSDTVMGILKSFRYSIDKEQKLFIVR